MAAARRAPAGPPRALRTRSAPCCCPGAEPALAGTMVKYFLGQSVLRSSWDQSNETQEKAKETALAATEKAKDLAGKVATKQQQQQQFI
ncbi:hypothetical protein AB1E18_009699 [Capra hircus]